MPNQVAFLKFLLFINWYWVIFGYFFPSGSCVIVCAHGVPARCPCSQIKFKYEKRQKGRGGGCRCRGHRFWYWIMHWFEYKPLNMNILKLKHATLMRWCFCHLHSIYKESKEDKGTRSSNNIRWSSWQNDQQRWPWCKYEDHIVECGWAEGLGEKEGLGCEFVVMLRN